MERGRLTPTVYAKNNSNFYQNFVTVVVFFFLNRMYLIMKNPIFHAIYPTELIEIS